MSSFFLLPRIVRRRTWLSPSTMPSVLSTFTNWAANWDDSAHSVIGNVSPPVVWQYKAWSKSFCWRKGSTRSPRRNETRKWWSRGDACSKSRLLLRALCLDLDDHAELLPRVVCFFRDELVRGDRPPVADDAPPGPLAPSILLARRVMRVGHG